MHSLGVARSQEYQVSVNVSDYQITVLIMTPSEPPPEPTNLPEFEDMYLIGRHRDPAGPHASPFPGQPSPPPYGYTIDLVEIWGAP